MAVVTPGGFQKIGTWFSMAADPNTGAAKFQPQMRVAGRALQKNLTEKSG